MESHFGRFEVNFTHSQQLKKSTSSKMTVFSPVFGITFNSYFVLKQRQCAFILTQKLRKVFCRWARKILTIYLIN